MLFRLVFIGILSASLTGCITYVTENGPKDAPRVSVQYDPYDYQMVDLQDAANAQCEAKGFRYGERVDNSVNTQAVRWSHMYFDCLGRPVK
ncbi:MAG: hypothetical protein V3V30_09115 [Parvularculaceae bacterium]